MAKSLPIAQVKAGYFDWLDTALCQIAKKRLKGAMICLYENDFFQAQILGYEKVDLSDDDWACKWTFDEKKLFDFASGRFAKEWEPALEKVKAWTSEYLQSSRVGALAMARIGPLAIGFADGEFEFLFPEELKDV